MSLFDVKVFKTSSIYWEKIEMINQWPLRLVISWPNLCCPDWAKQNWPNIGIELQGAKHCELGTPVQSLLLKHKYNAKEIVNMDRC